MGSVKRFCEDCATAGRCPISRETWEHLDRLEAADTTLDWIAYCEHEFVGRDGRLCVEDCITMESARRLIAEDRANDEIIRFVEYWGDCCPA